MTSAKRRDGFSMAELLVSVVVVLLLIYFLALPAGQPGRPKAQRIKCINNLKNVGLAIRIFSTDNNDLLPSDLAPTNGLNLATITAADFFRSFSNELSSPRIIMCPSDSRCVPAASFQALSNLNVSYFANLSAHPSNTNNILAGDRNLQTNGVSVESARLAVSPGFRLSWSREIHNEAGQLLLSDGSVQPIRGSDLPGYVSAIPGTNLWLIP